MYSTSVDLKTGNGQMPLANFDTLVKAAQPTIGDLLYAGQRQRTRILERTARGVDVNETAFAPYSTKGPYYYYPGKNAKNRRAAVTRAAKKLGVAVKGGPNRKGESVTRVGIKFASYAAFKRALGRAFVDLRGPSAPHMLQAIIVKVAGITLPGADPAQGNLFADTSVSGDLYSNETPASEIVLGIYGNEADRATGHNTGRGHLPKRRFFGASETDKTAVLDDILKRVLFRLKKVMGGAR